jgi:hypothetical protein
LNTVSIDNGTIGGGQSNSVSGQWGVVCGGLSNAVGTTKSVIGGGDFNTINNNSTFATIGGGSNNLIGFSTYSAIGGGANNNIQGGASTKSYNYIGGGRQNTVQESQYTVISGGWFNYTNADFSSICGGYQGQTDLYGQTAHASGNFAATGDAQAHELVWRRAVTGIAITEIFLDGTSVAAILPAGNTLWQGTIEIAAFCSDTGNGTTPLGNAQGTTYKVTIKRLGATTSLVGTVQEIGVMNNDPTVVGTFTIDANDTNESLRIQFTPPATAGSTTVHRVVATFRGLQIKY